jgi:hypothetical protein
MMSIRKMVGTAAHKRTSARGVQDELEGNVRDFKKLFNKSRI